MNEIYYNKIYFLFKFEVNVKYFIPTFLYIYIYIDIYIYIY
jgi:hypothetical protein